MTVLLIKYAPQDILISYSQRNTSNIIYTDLITDNEVNLAPGEELFLLKDAHHFFIDMKGYWIFPMKDVILSEKTEFFYITIFYEFPKTFTIRKNCINSIDLAEQLLTYKDAILDFPKYDSIKIISIPNKGCGYYREKWLKIMCKTKIQEHYEDSNNPLFIINILGTNNYLMPNSGLITLFDKTVFSSEIIERILLQSKKRLWNIPNSERYPEALVLAGGGVLGLSTLGALSCYENIMSKIQLFVGTSSGALISTLISIGYTPTEIFEYFCSIDLSLFYENENSVVTVTRFLAKFALSNGNSKLREHLEILFQKKGVDKDINFYDLYVLTKKFLIVTVCCLNTSAAEYFHLASAPKLLVIDALIMSSCLPFIWEPIIYNQNMYVDGGLVDNLPMEQIYLLRHLQKLMTDITINKDNIVEKFNRINKTKMFVPCLGLNLDKNTSDIYSTQAIGHSVLSYIRRIITIMVKSITKVNTELSPYVVNVFVPAGVNSRDFGLSNEQKHEMFRQAKLALMRG